MANTEAGVRKTCKRWNVPWQAHELNFNCYHEGPFLTSDRTRAFLVESIQRARVVHQFHLWAYVFMPEHVHLIIWPTCETYDISAILKSIKQPVSRRVVNWLKRNDPSGLKGLETGQRDKPYQFWQDGGGYDHNLRTAEELRGMMTYIHNNPVRRELVKLAEDWPWSSAQFWAGLREGPIPIDKESCLDAMA